jgi:pilus assembly protein CpaC
MSSDRFSALLLSWCLLFVSHGAAQPDEALTIQLAVGEQKVLPSEGVRSYSEGVKGIVDVRLTREGNQFVIVGIQPGTTTLLFLMQNGSERHYKISVGSPPTEEQNGDPSHVGARDNIRLDFYFVSLVKNYNHQAGVSWPARLAVGPTPEITLNLRTGDLNADTVVLNSVLPGLDMAQSSGWAKLLRKAAVITANGTEATFSGGGEVNVIAAGGLQSTIQRIQFGSVIKVQPRYDRSSGRIELQIDADISDLAPDNGTKVPGRTTSKLTSIVNIELGQSLVLAGLSASTKTKTRAGLPGLSQIPILGALFGSQRMEQQETENLVLIVPSVVDAVSEQKRDRIRQALHAFEQYRGKIDQARLTDRIAPRPTNTTRGR